MTKEQRRDDRAVVREVLAACGCSIPDGIGADETLGIAARVIWEHVEEAVSPWIGKLSQAHDLMFLLASGAAAAAYLDAHKWVCKNCRGEYHEKRRLLEYLSTRRNEELKAAGPELAKAEQEAGPICGTEPRDMRTSADEM